MITDDERELLIELIRRVKEETDEDYKKLLIQECKEIFPDFEEEFLKKKMRFINETPHHLQAS